MTHGSLFSGIGGFDLAAEWCGFTNKWQCEKDKFCIKVLEKNFPKIKRYRDIYEIKTIETVDIISGGFPCQPFSHAGKRKGTSDDRYLWAEMFRIIQLAKPSWLVIENVYGLINIQNGLVFEQVLSDLEDEGYETQSYVIPASGVNAPHRRNRIWIIANRNLQYKHRTTRKDESKNGESSISKWYKIQRIIQSDTLSNTNPCSEYSKEHTQRKFYTGGWDKDWIQVATEFCRVDDGIPNRLDRIKALGNAIVPQIAYNIFSVINNVKD